MSYRLAEYPESHCRDCKSPFRLEVWVIIDEQERPDLIRKVHDGTLRQFRCHRCGASGRVDAPLLIFRPGQPRYQLVLSPRDLSTSHEDKREAGNLLTELFSVVENPERLPLPLVVPWPALPVTLLRDVDRDRLDPAWAEQVPPDIAPFYRVVLERANRLNE